jgi:hypothetical protein
MRWLSARPAFRRGAAHLCCHHGPGREPLAAFRPGWPCVFSGTPAGMGCPVRRKRALRRSHWSGIAKHPVRCSSDIRRRSAAVGRVPVIVESPPSGQRRQPAVSTQGSRVLKWCRGRLARPPSPGSAQRRRHCLTVRRAPNRCSCHSGRPCTMGASGTPKAGTSTRGWPRRGEAPGLLAAPGASALRRFAMPGIVATPGERSSARRIAPESDHCTAGRDPGQGITGARRGREGGRRGHTPAVKPGRSAHVTLTYPMNLPGLMEAAVLPDSRTLSSSR